MRWISLADVMDYAWCPKFLEHRLEYFRRGQTDELEFYSVQSGSLFHELNRYEEELYLAPTVEPEDDFEAAQRTLHKYMKSSNRLFWGDGYRAPIISQKHRIFGFLDGLEKEGETWRISLKRQNGGVRANVQARLALQMLLLEEMGVRIEEAAVETYQGILLIERDDGLLLWAQQLLTLTRMLLDRGLADIAEIQLRACTACSHHHCYRKVFLRQMKEDNKGGWIDL